MLVLQHLWIFLLFSAFFAGVLVAEESGIPDVTTIFNLRSDKKADNPVEIHMKNNNKGMPVFVENVGFVEPENEQSNLLCFHPISWGKKMCDWTSENFVWTSTTDYYWKDVIQKYDKLFKNSVAFSACANLFTNRNYRPSTCTIQLDLKTSISSNLYLQITITQEEGDYYDNCNLQIDSQLCSKQVDSVGECTSLQFQSTSMAVDLRNSVRHGRLLGLTRKPRMAWTGWTEEVSDQDKVFLFIEIEKTKLKVWKEVNRITLLSEADVDDSSMNKIKTISSSDNLDIHQFKVLETETLNSSLTSRPFQVASSQFCLRVILQFTSPSGDEIMTATAVDSNNDHHPLGTLIQPREAGWFSWKLEASLPDELVGKSVYIVLRTLTSSMIRIQRIASCSSNDEHFAVITSEMTDQIQPIQGGATIVLMDQPFKTFGKSSECENGGILTSSGCACPAGFAGPNCTQGCGPNRYGQDCGSQCSVYSHQCAGLMLCTPWAGCHCAPGYRGETCELSCLPGTYGANCTENCGQCKERDQPFFIEPVCDMFTGSCQACMPGYYPPFCKLKYTHFNKAPLLSTTKYGAVAVSIKFAKDYIIGSGEPAFYQVQYKRGASMGGWTVFSTGQVPQDLNSETQVEVEVDGLEDGVEYLVRIVLLAQDLNSYQAEDIPRANVLTKCDVPLSYDYNISVSHYVSEGIPLLFQDSGSILTSFSWAPYTIKEHMCPLVEYEVSWKDGWWWNSKTVSAQELRILQLANVMPNQKLSFKVRAKITDGFAPYSFILHTRSPYKGIFKVTNLTANNIQSDRADITWQPPAEDKETEFIYTVTYTCIYRACCETPCQSEGSQTTKDTSVVLSHLLPVSQYKVSVSSDNGPNTTILIGTLQSVPVETPKMSNLEPVRTNSSLTVFWEHAPVCSGFFQIYTYQLYQTSDTTKIIDSGKTKHRNVTFTQLHAATDYTVRVSVVTTGGWDPDTFLAINVSTTATVPEVVQNLTVYKRSRGSIGLRWAEPRALFGALSSFSVTYWPLNSGPETKNISVRVEPKHCAVWPHLYCYNLEGLSPVRSYSIIVRARNAVIPEDGAGAVVIAVTKESSPGAPENLSVINVTSTSLGLQWEHPNLTNGILRSFLVSVEETDRFDYDQCCQIYPIFEIQVSEERKFYQLEVSGLHPASTYSISVGGKTVGFGPSVTVTASTCPPPLRVPLPGLDVDGLDVFPLIEWETQTPSELNSSAISYASLIKSRILLVISNTSLVEAPIEDVRLKSLLDERISQPFYITAKYNEGDVLSLQPAEGEESEWGKICRPQFQENIKYQLASVQISEYNGVLNTDVVFSTPFHIRPLTANAVESL